MPQTETCRAGPQALADASGEITVSGTPKLLKFKLQANSVSLLNAKRTIWFNASAEVVD